MLNTPACCVPVLLLGWYVMLSQLDFVFGFLTNKEKIQGRIWLMWHYEFELLLLQWSVVGNQIDSSLKQISPGFHRHMGHLLKEGWKLAYRHFLATIVGPKSESWSQNLGNFGSKGWINLVAIFHAHSTAVYFGSFNFNKAWSVYSAFYRSMTGPHSSFIAHSLRNRSSKN